MVGCAWLVQVVVRCFADPTLVRGPDKRSGAGGCGRPFSQWKKKQSGFFMDTGRNTACWGTDTNSVQQNCPQPTIADHPASQRCLLPRRTAGRWQLTESGSGNDGPFRLIVNQRRLAVTRLRWVSHR